MDTAELIVTALAVYGAVGLVFAALFVTIWLEQVDPEAKGAKLGLRLLFVPGAAGLWPLVALRVLAPTAKEGAK